jgi:hypothetical protein
MRAPSCFVLVLACVIASTHAATTRTHNAQPLGDGVLEGAVVSAEVPPNPIARAIVTLTGQSATRDRETLTDAIGRFRFAGLPQSSYSLTVLKASYIPARYGATRPGGKGTDLVLRDNQILGDLRITLFKGGVVSGRIVDVRGRVLSGVDVQLFRLQWNANGGRSSLPVQTVVTNAEGAYRAFGLLPGSYVIAAGRDLDVPLRMATVSENDALLASGRPAPAVSALDGSYRLSPIFAPGTADPDQARIVSVAAGEEVAGVGVTVFPVPAQRISGSLRSADGAGVAPVNITLADGLGRGTTVRATGTSASVPFTFGAVLPGRYRLSASTGGRPQDGPFRWAFQELTASGASLHNIDLILRTGVNVTGRLESDVKGAGAPPGWFVALVACDPRSEPALTTGVAAVAPDGFFRLSASPGRYWIIAVSQRTMDDLGRDWSVKSTIVRGSDRGDEPVELRSGEDLGDVRLVLTPDSPVLAGTVRTVEGQPMSDRSVICFPVDPAQRSAPLGSIKSVRPSTDGQYRITGLRPGAYYVAAIADVEPGEWFAPRFFDAVMPAASRVELGHAQTTVRDLTISK